ncbi:(2Fe-2S)-binding protein [Thalassobacillus devorans]|uniref:(2Fe-2S)-binding protein n=1 Tax=Thalassobacillus devorans TaxID=279813 RepID=UPI000A1C9713|nr:(2Fe-2S)-binding protein [Thalassobacillus devorans]
MNQQDFLVCRCEEVTYNELMETASRNGCTARELKLRTRAGMGYCGGRTCRPLVQQITKKLEQAPHTRVTLKYQPPVRPISFGVLGGGEE